jgi:tRNA dimethylallyltransferase
MSLPRILCIVGPTSSGKTALSLALAKKFDGEIVNADARQLYRGFDIGTGKPSFEERTGVPHYLFDEDPAQQISVSEWKEKALACIREIVSRGRLPILVGGTGLYVQALVDNFSIPEVAPQVELRDELSSLSLEALVKRLEEVDPDALEIVDLKNPRRVIRALEVALTTGRSFVDARQKGESLVDALQLGIERSREDLYARSEAAVDEMLARGWVEEVRELFTQGFTKETPAMSAIGYRELEDVVRGRSTLTEVVPGIKQATRNYIKRQVTWFKRDERIVWVSDQEGAEELVRSWLAV